MEQTTTWPPQIPNQNPNPNPPQPQQPISTSIYSYPPPPPPPDPQNSIVTTTATAQFYTNSDPTTTATTLWPPGVDYSYTSYQSVGYYFDPISHNWAAKAAVRHYGSDPGAVYANSVSAAVHPNGTEQLAIAHLGSTAWINHTLQPHGTSTQKRQNKTKVVQSAYCEICKVDCNSKDVLDLHKLGKKHKKNLEKLQATAAGCSATAGSSNPVIGPQENPNKSANGVQQKSKKKKAEPLENLETKRRKMVEGGAAAEAVRACSICNVVCNSETVFNAHLAGQKHATMLKKHTGGRRVATAT